MRIEIDGEYSGIKFSASHIIPGHDKCGRLHGHGYILHLVLYGEKAADGMVMDFVDAKEGTEEIVDELDHRVLLPARSPDGQDQEGAGGRGPGRERRGMYSPNEDVAILDIAQTSAEELAELVLERLLKVLDLPPNVHDHRGRPGRGAGADRLGQAGGGGYEQGGGPPLRADWTRPRPSLTPSPRATRSYALTIGYGQRHSRELASARAVAEHYRLKKHVSLDLDLSFLRTSALTSWDCVGTPAESCGGHRRASIPVTYVPARNIIMLSLAARAV